MVDNGVIHGRFQIFHLKHMEYLLAAKMHCRKLYIGIARPDNTFAASSPLDIHGTTRRDNPMTYLERVEMIQGALAGFGIKREEYEIVPFPINRPEYITQYVPENAVHYVGIYDEWSEERYQRLVQQKLNVVVLWRKNPEEKGLVATDVRMAIERGENWQNLVPKSVYEYVISHGIDQRIREYARKGFATGEGIQ